MHESEQKVSTTKETGKVVLLKDICNIATAARQGRPRNNLDVAVQTLMDKYGINDDEWVLDMKGSCGSSLNFTNNHLESFNGKLKQVIDRHSSLEDFIDKFFIILNSLRRKWDHKAATMFQKVKVSCFEDDSPQSLYSKLLSNYAAQFVHKQLLLASKVLTITTDGDCYTVETTEGQMKLSTSTCTCIFNKSMLLPCHHIFALRSQLGEPLFKASLCDKQWSSTYYRSTQRIFSETLWIYGDIYISKALPSPNPTSEVS